MKKTLLLSALVVVMSMTSCNKEIGTAVPSDNNSVTRTVTFTTTAPDTKTVFTTPEGSNYPVIWTATDTEVAVNLNYTADDPIKKVAIIRSADNKTASFTASIETGLAEYTFLSVSPAAALSSVSKSNSRLNLDIPSAQTPTATSPDERAMVLYAKSGTLTELPDNVNLTFHHFTGYLHLTFTNYSAALTAAGATVQNVSLTSSVKIAGRAFFFPESGAITENSLTNTVTATTTSLDDVWLALVPADLSNATLTFVIGTDKGTITKEVVLGASKDLTSGKIARMTIDLDGIAVVAPVRYNLVTAANQLHVGDKVMIVAANYDKAMSTMQKANNRSEAAVTKGDGFILDPSAAVEIIELEDGFVPGEYALKSSSGYLYAAAGAYAGASGNLLRTAASITAGKLVDSNQNPVKEAALSNGSFDISILDAQANGSNEPDPSGTTDHVAKILAKANATGLIRYNVASSLFSAYGSSTSMSYVHLYRLNEDPDLSARFKASMPDDDGTGNVAVTAAGGDLSVYVFGNSAWTAAVTGGASLDATSGTGNTILTLTIPANVSTTETQSYTVTVSTTAGVVPNSYTFTLTQAKAINTGGGDPVLVYSIVPTGDDGTQDTFAGNSDADMNGITWNITGNGKTGEAFWRIGGKSLNNVGRGFYSKTPLAHEVTKIIVHHGTVDSGCTVNSFTLTVHSSASDASTGANPIATLAGAIPTSDSDVTFNKADATSWAGCYYRFIYNFTVTATKNKRLQMKGVDFYGFLSE